MFCFLTRLLRQDIVKDNDRIKLRRRRWQLNLLRLTATALAAFILSWSPYCFVSVISIFRGNNLLSPGEAEIPALMAKASVIYNPFVYTVLNKRFRMTLSRLCCKKVKFFSKYNRSSYRPEVVFSSRHPGRPSLTKFASTFTFTSR